MSDATRKYCVGNMYILNRPQSSNVVWSHKLHNVVNSRHAALGTII